MTPKETIESLTKTERQELGKCYTNPIRFAKLLPKYKSLIDEIMSMRLADTLSESVYMITNGLLTQPLCKACQYPLIYKTSTYTYGEYCDHKCRATFNNVERDAIIIDGVTYPSIKDAVEATGESRYIIKSKLLSVDSPEYEYVGDHDTICRSVIREIHPSLLDRNVLVEWKASGGTLQSFADSLEKNISTVSLALSYHGIDAKFEQISQVNVRNLLRSESAFVTMFETMSMEAMAKSLGVMDGTIRTYALKYGLNTARKGWNRSRGEIELFDYISSICPSVTHSAMLIPNSKLEADIYIDERKLAFEYNGCYTHSEKFKDHQYHKTKLDLFNSVGIRLIQIWEDDWDMNRDVVKKLISNILSNSNERIGARETTVVELTKEQFDDFMTQNHMQGTTSAAIKLGLVHNGIVVSAMGFTNLPSNVKREHEGDGVSLVRFANTNVTGAFAKLLNFFQKTFIKYTHVTTFADLEIVSSTSNIYLNNGFVEIGKLPVDYKYFKKQLGARKHKFLFRKDRFAAMGVDIVGKTEAELATECELLRCYDSGKIKYLKILK